MEPEYGKAMATALLFAAGLLLLDLLAPGTARFGGAALLAVVIRAALIAPEEA